MGEADGKERIKIYDNITGKPETHPCKQEKRLDRLEKRQDDTIKNIDEKLGLIWNAIAAGDNRNTLYIITMAGTMIASLAAVFIAFMAFFRTP